jgi:hypothetical protein
MNPIKSLPYGPQRPSPNSPDDFNGNITLGLSIFFLVLLIIVTIGRFLAIHWNRSSKFGLDDLFLLMAAPVAATYLALTVYEFASKKCAGRHMWFCSYADMNEIYLVRYSETLHKYSHLTRTSYSFEHQIFNIDQTIFYFSVYCAKISMLYYLRRLTNGGATIYKYAHWTILLMLISCGLISYSGQHSNARPLQLAGASKHSPRSPQHSTNASTTTSSSSGSEACTSEPIFSFSSSPSSSWKTQNPTPQEGRHLSHLLDGNGVYRVQSCSERHIWESKDRLPL